MHPLDERIPRLAPCPCGSGRRFKDCHGALGRLGGGAQAQDAKVAELRPAPKVKTGPVAKPSAKAGAKIAKAKVKTKTAVRAAKSPTSPPAES